MNEERVVLCGGVADPGGLGKREPLLLNLQDPDPNVNLKIEDIHERVAANIPAIFLDLLEIAAYVYAADTATPRGGAGVVNYGAGWRREFDFHIPVREPDRWSSDDVRSALQDTLGTLSEDTFRFHFTRLADPPPVARYLDFPAGRAATAIVPEDVALFSGGLDSLAGAVEEAVNKHRRIALVSHIPVSKIAARQRELDEALAERCKDAAPFHVPVWVNKDKPFGREHTQRTRSFLYSSIGATVATMFGLPRILFFENGITSLNFPISEQLIGARASRTTHPQVLNGFAKLFTALRGSSFQVDNPFLWKTKTEVVNLIGDAGCAGLIKKSASCSHTIESTTDHPHCGRCSQCVDRRFATLASKYASDDPADLYGVDLLTGKREKDDRTLVEAYVATNLDINRLSDIGFFMRFGEVGRVLKHVGGTAQEASTKIWELHRRHAQEVAGVVEQAHKDHARELVNGELPDSCLVVLALNEKYRRPAAPAQPVAEKEAEARPEGADEKAPRKKEHRIEVWVLIDMGAVPDTGKVTETQLREMMVRISGKTIERANKGKAGAKWAGWCGPDEKHQYDLDVAFGVRAFRELVSQTVRDRLQLHLTDGAKQLVKRLHKAGYSHAEIAQLSGFCCAPPVTRAARKVECGGEPEEMVNRGRKDRYGREETERRGEG